MELEIYGTEETRGGRSVCSRGGVKATHMDGDLSVGGGVHIGGETVLQGCAEVRGDFKVGGCLIAHNVKGCYKGLFMTPALLREAYPHSHEGWWALVGKTVPAALWYDKHGEWGTDGETGMDPDGTVTTRAFEYTDGKAAEAKGYTDEKAAEAKGYTDMKMPVGTVLIWAGEEAPKDYMVCDGRAVSKTQYPELYAVIGERYNSTKQYNPDGSVSQVPLEVPEGHFLLPNLQERFIVGYNAQSDDDTYKVLGGSGGERKHELTVDEMPSHQHGFSDAYLATSEDGTAISGTTKKLKGNVSAVQTGVVQTSPWIHYEDKLTMAGGQGKSHENRPPYYVMNYIIRVK